MQVLLLLLRVLFATALLYLKHFADAAAEPLKPKAADNNTTTTNNSINNNKCPARCDVSTCPSPSCPTGYVPDRCSCCLVCAQGEGEPCSRSSRKGSLLLLRLLLHTPPELSCGEGLECKQHAWPSRHKGKCQCKQGHRVCGSDGKTYGNPCRRRAASKEALQQGRAGIEQAHKGPCESGTGKI